ncbi:MAG: hypothetical protein K8R88_08085, partial [Armatimonadetes bacterium]|nr:hypothetical protein [Armatimonadota bacterium]
MAVRSSTGASTSAKPKKARSPWKRRFKILGILFAIVIAATLIAGTVIWTKYLSAAAEQLPKLDQYRALLSSEPTRILSADSKPVVLFEIAAEK